MQLRRRSSTATACALLWLSIDTAARADDSNVTTRGFSEVGAYHDNVAVNVLTPSLGASVENSTAGWGINGRYLVDFVSAASPDIVATASPPFKEIRNAGSVGAKYKQGTVGIVVNGGASYTPDYLAISGNALLTKELDEKNVTITAGYGFGRDTIGRTGTSFSVYSHVLTYHTITAGFSRLLGPSVTAGVTADAIIEHGDQSKPYRYIPIFGPGANPQAGASVAEVSDLRIQARPLEQLPTSRNRGSLTGHLAWRFERSTLRIDERVYADSWALLATTTDARYFIDVSRRLIVWPHLRFHAQNGVDFWQRVYAATDAHHLPTLRTGDRELSPLQNIGAGGGARIALGKPGRLEDYVLTTTLDGTYTQFNDALYITSRISALAAVGLEVIF